MGREELRITMRLGNWATGSVIVLNRNKEVQKRFGFRGKIMIFILDLMSLRAKWIYLALI